MSNYLKQILLCSTIAACPVFGVGTAFAQDSEQTDTGAAQGEDDVIVVTASYQRSLADALNEKRTADIVVDVVSAEDIGKFADVSIGDTIARLPGVVANRDRGNATELSVRGLGPNLTNTLVNGHEVATGESSRNVRFEQYPAELLSGAYVFKSPKASQPAGGVGGTIDLRTVNPLDHKRRKIVVNLRGSYNELADDIAAADPLGYTGSISYIDQFADNTLGVALGFSRREQPISTVRTNIFPYGDSFADINGDGSTAAGFFGDLAPFGFEGLTRGGDDDRNGVIGVVQWEQAGSGFSAKASAFYSGVDFVEEQRGFRVENAIFGNDRSNVTVQDNFLTGGTLTQNAGFGLQVSTVNEEFRLFDDAYSGDLALKYLDGPMSAALDASYSQVDRELQFLSVQTRLHDVTGANPFEFTSGTAATFGNVNGRGAFSFNRDLSDPAINLPATVSIPDSDSVKDTIFAVGSDFKYEFDSSFLRAISAGAKYSRREKSLIARSAFPFIDPANRTPIPAGLLQDPVRGFGEFSDLPPVLSFDIQGVVDQVFGGANPVQTNFNQTESWQVDEDILAGYVQLDYDGDLFGIPVSGNIGVRVENTDTSSSSVALLNGQETNFVEVLTPFTIKNSYTNVLPSFNLAIRPGDRHIIRFGAAKTISRAPLDDLRAGVGEFNFGFSEAFGGNPLLQPFETDQLDLTYEIYFTDNAALTFSCFYKDVKTFIVRTTQTGVTLPSGAIGNFTQPINGNGGNIKGLEVTFQAPLDFLPGFLDGLGVYTNYTYVDSNITVDPAFVTGTFPLPGLAKHTLNAQLWYYKAGFEWRLGYKFRDALPAELGDVPDQILFNDEEHTLDFQASYEFPESSTLSGLKVLFQASNLTDEPFQTFYGSSNARGRYEKFGRKYYFGFSYAF